MKKYIAGAALALVVAGVLAASTGSGTFTEPIEAGQLRALGGVEELRGRFNDDAGSPRLILLVSPTCPICIAGASWVQDEILTKNPDRDISVYAVWFNVLPTDSVGGWEPEILSDRRVTEFWDAEGAVGEWFGEKREELQLGFFGGPVVWDASLLFGPEASWQELPGPLEHFGYTIIGDRRSLLTSLEAIWAVNPAA